MPLILAVSLDAASSSNEVRQESQSHIKLDFVDLAENSLKKALLHISLSYVEQTAWNKFLHLVHPIMESSGTILEHDEHFPSGCN